VVSSFIEASFSASQQAAGSATGATPAKPALEFVNVSFSYGAQTKTCISKSTHSALHDLNFAVSEGELVTITGPNGGGKTTLLHLACGLIKPTHGEVAIERRGARSLTRAAIARAVALAPQYLPYTPWLSVGNVVELGRYAARADSAADAALVEGAMQRVRVAHLANRTCGEISGGELRRVHLARAIAQDSRVLLLDEPTGDLDLHHVGLLMSVIAELAHDGRAVVVVTHDLNFAVALGGRTIVIKDGTIVFDGTVSGFLDESVLYGVYPGGFRIVQGANGTRVVLPVPSNMQAGERGIEARGE
jgi:iron complex transport system ATP-binding protein